MKRSDLPYIKVPTPYDGIHKRLYPYKQDFNYIDGRKNFKCRYDMYYPKGFIFSNRECHFTFLGYYEKRSLLPFGQEGRWNVQMYVTAYPSAEGKCDGFSFTFSQFKRGRGAVFCEDKIYDAGVALSRMLQKFIDSGDEYYNIEADPLYTRGNIFVNLSQRMVEDNDFSFYGACYHELRNVMR